jgi:hypothetical protein
MFHLLRALFPAPARLPDYVHFHIDDSGQRRLCDESACRPPVDPLGDITLFLPFR